MGNSSERSLKILYGVDIKHLTPLSIEDLNKWSIDALSKNKKGYDAMDILYAMT
jgi:hypothetical protein